MAGLPIRQSRFTRFRRWTAKPKAMLLWVAILVLHTLMLWLGFDASSDRFLLYSQQPRHRPSSALFYIYRTPDGLQPVVHGSLDQSALHERDGHELLGRAMSMRLYGLPRVGLWAPTRVELNHTVLFEARMPLSTDEQAQARAEIVKQELEGFTEYFEGRLWQQWAELLRAGDGITYVPIWHGYLHNVVAIALFGLSVRALVFSGAHRIRSGRAKRRTRAGLCGDCGYDLRGVAGSVCPECGYLKP